VFNRALLGKWFWRHVHERKALWRVVVDSKYGSAWGGCVQMRSMGHMEWGLCKNIKRGWGELSSVTIFEVGTGSKIQFWHGLWCRIKPSSMAFPVLFGISRFKEVAMADHLELSSASH